MKTLLLLRHAKSSRDDAALPDHDRPLNDRGKQDAPRIGRLLRDQQLRPDGVLSSTAKRARQTARRAIEASGYPLEVELEPALYLADPAAWVRVLRAQDDRRGCLLAVGHNPGLEDLLRALSGRSESLPTAALAQLELPIDHWNELALGTRGALRSLWRPKELDD